MFLHRVNNIEHNKKQSIQEQRNLSSTYDTVYKNSYLKNDASSF